MFRDSRMPLLLAIVLLILIWSNPLPLRLPAHSNAFQSKANPWLAFTNTPASSSAEELLHDVDNEDETSTSTTVPKRGKEKATLLMLVRNSELQETLRSMRRLEDRFNRKFNYPWTFLNDEDFTDEFKNHTTAMTNGKTEYAKIPEKHWSIPKGIDESKVEEAMMAMKNVHVPYATSWSYRHMCRFNSGFFFLQDVLKKYDWYFRVEPGVNYWCDMDDDPFTYMRENKKKYGWVITIKDVAATLPTLWPTAREFFKNNTDLVHPKNSLSWLMNNPEQGIESDYNTCHFWSNFEIASLNFFRSEKYQRFFKHLDEAKGFFHERWGDAPVHSIAVGLMLDKNEIHRFDIGYEHNPYRRCNPEAPMIGRNKCLCPRDAQLKDNIDHNMDYSCTPQWYKNMQSENPK